MTRTIAVLALASILCSSAPARAEIDLSGSWASINHEDALERGGGPNPDDWAGREADGLLLVPHAGEYLYRCA